MEFAEKWNQKKRALYIKSNIQTEWPSQLRKAQQSDVHEAWQKINISVDESDFYLTNSEAWDQDVVGADLKN